jgi:hypothetical protein
MASDVGRPTIYSKELDIEICSRIAGGESLRSIAVDEHMPARQTVYRWLFDDEHIEFSDHYKSARKMQAENLADELFDISDDGSNDWMERTGKDGESAGWQVNGEHVQRSRLRLDTRKWYLSKVLPKFADKQQIENTHKFDGLSDIELENRIKALENDLNGEG